MRINLVVFFKSLLAGFNWADAKEIARAVVAIKSGQSYGPITVRSVNVPFLGDVDLAVTVYPEGGAPK